MTAKTSDWRPGPTVCRCCLAEGCYKDISTEYFWMGKREVYAELLLDTLDVSIAYSKSGPNSNSRLICEPCISRLRDAHDFKRQVLECEKTFMQHLDPGSSSVQNEVQLTLEEVKVERVKQEKKQSDDEDFDDGIDFVVNDDSDDDLDNEPLVTLASKVPKKEKEVDILDLLDSSQITVKRKATASSSKAKEPPAKKAKKQIVIKPSASKATTSAAKTGEKKKKGPVDLNKKRMSTHHQKNNALVLLNNSNICPFNFRENFFLCCCCNFSSGEFDSVRRHIDKHSDISDAIRMPCGIILKADVTDLQCKLCLQSLRDIPSLADHLIAFHAQPIEKQYGLGIMSFRLFNQITFECVHCNRICDTFRSLNCHMNGHYPNVACTKCNKYFADYQRMKGHLFKRHKIEKKTDERDNALIILKHSNMCPFKYRYAFLCFYCDFSAPEIRAIRDHTLTAEHTNVIQKSKLLSNRFVKVDITNLRCELCYQNMEDVPSLVDHLIEIHDQPIKKKYGTGIMSFLIEGRGPFKCTHCDLTFKHYLKLNVHMNNHYANSICSECGQTFADPHKLKCHVTKVHDNKIVNLRSEFPENVKGVETKITNVFKCTFCNEMFPSNLARMEHIRVKHRTTKDYRCSICPVVFKQPIERKTHFQSLHMKQELFSCDYCLYRCVTKAKLRNHIKTHTGDTIVCELCGKSLDPKIQTKHMRFHHNR